MPKSAFLSLTAIASIPLIITLGNSMLIPILPVVERQIGISSFQSSLIISVYSIVAALFIPLAGLLSDHVGRKKVILPSLAISGAGGLIAGLAAVLSPHPFYMILLGRFIQGVGAAGAFPLVLPLVADVFPKEEDVSHGLGVAETANTVGKVLSPILGTLLASVIWYLPFFTIPILALVSLLLIAFWIDGATSKTTNQSLRNFAKNLHDVMKREGKWLTAVFSAGIIIMIVLFGLLVYLSNVLESSYHIFGIKKGLLLAIPVGTISLASYLAGRFIGEDKARMRRTSLTGLSLMGAASLAMIFFRGLWLLLLLTAVGGFGIGISLPSLDAILTESVEQDQRGTLTSLYSGMRYAGVAVGPPLFSLLQGYSVSAMFLSASALSFTSVLLIFFLIRPPQEKACL